ncbi:hypothetical protein [Candidatus Odyssella acanthamoebae]|uniref:Uncharacterized protein n=1 Tax=Candidatus Odyssella acanthamoebae TaxID=91604 RepID=A0A077ATW3_9PROT|nr:hypothetical protein [Candidatus Paracaedibacter acanthamoebae]AIK96637.1 hypothetical protein ID47_07760 [Candidatus Paracaedibacter acanthamoebae]
MLKAYLYKCLLILSVSSFSIPYCVAHDEPSESTVPHKRPSKELEPASQVEKQSETIPQKKQKVEREETVEKKEASEGEEEQELESTDLLPLEGSFTKAADIGTWVGDKENGIANFRLSYNGKLISEEIKKWHLEMGTQIQQIANLRGLKKNKTNYIRARIDIVYKKRPII